MNWSEIGRQVTVAIAFNHLITWRMPTTWTMEKSLALACEVMDMCLTQDEESAMWTEHGN